MYTDCSLFSKKPGEPVTMLAVMLGLIQSQVKRADIIETNNNIFMDSANESLVFSLVITAMPDLPY